jgi:hypothetical protein
MSVRHIKVVTNAVLHRLQLTTKIIVTTLRNKTKNHAVIETDQCVDFITKMFVSKIVRD